MIKHALKDILNLNIKILKRHTEIPGLWTQKLNARLWTLDATLWTLGSEHWTLSLTVSEQNQNPVSDFS